MLPCLQRQTFSAAMSLWCSTDDAGQDTLQLLPRDSDFLAAWVLLARRRTTTMGRGCTLLLVVLSFSAAVGADLEPMSARQVSNFKPVTVQALGHCSARSAHPVGPTRLKKFRVSLLPGAA